MRDPDRIDCVIEKINKYWDSMEVNSLPELVSEVSKVNNYNDPFHMEDDQIISYLDNRNDSSTNNEDISDVVSSFKSYWIERPDLRMSQIIANAAIDNGYNSTVTDINKMSDDELKKYISEN